MNVPRSSNSLSLFLMNHVVRTLWTIQLLPSQTRWWMPAVKRGGKIHGRFVLSEGTLSYSNVLIVCTYTHTYYIHTHTHTYMYVKTYTHPENQFFVGALCLLIIKFWWKVINLSLSFVGESLKNRERGGEMKTMTLVWLEEWIWRNREGGQIQKDLPNFIYPAIWFTI